MTTTAVTPTEADGSAVGVELDVLLRGEDFAVVDIPVRQPLPAASLLETFPRPMAEKALWWEGHILEVLHGLPPGTEPGTLPRPEYGPDRSLTARQRAKAAELTTAGHKVAAQTVANYRRRYQADGVGRYQADGVGPRGLRRTGRGAVSRAGWRPASRRCG